MQVILSHDESYKSQKSIIFNATMFHEFVVQKKKEKTAFIDQRAVAAGKKKLLSGEILHAAQQAGTTLTCFSEFLISI